MREIRDITRKQMYQSLTGSGSFTFSFFVWQNENAFYESKNILRWSYEVQYKYQVGNEKAVVIDD